MTKIEITTADVITASNENVFSVKSLGDFSDSTFAMGFDDFT